MSTAKDHGKNFKKTAEEMCNIHNMAAKMQMKAEMELMHPYEAIATTAQFENEIHVLNNMMCKLRVNDLNVLLYAVDKSPPTTTTTTITTTTTSTTEKTGCKTEPTTTTTEKPQGCATEPTTTTTTTTTTPAPTTTTIERQGCGTDPTTTTTTTPQPQGCATEPTKTTATTQLPSEYVDKKQLSQR